MGSRRGDASSGRRGWRGSYELERSIGREHTLSPGEGVSSFLVEGGGTNESERDATDQSFSHWAFGDVRLDPSRCVLKSDEDVVDWYEAFFRWFGGLDSEGRGRSRWVGGGEESAKVERGEGEMNVLVLRSIHVSSNRLRSQYPAYLVH